MEQGTFDFALAKAPAPTKLCACGCGGPAPIAKNTIRAKGHVKGQPLRFIDGHSSRFRSAQLAAQRALEVPREVKLCECGCGEPAPIAARTSARWGHVQGQPMRFIRGHSARLTAASYTDALNIADVLPGVQLCGCGCGLPAPIAKQNNPERGHVRGLPERFIRGHQRAAPGESAFNGLLRGYKASAAKHGLAWGLSDDEFRHLTQLNCHYCGVAPSATRKAQVRSSGDFIYNGVDRVDSARPYEPSNVVTACKHCNYAKRDLSYGDFAAWVARVASRLLKAA